jgi:hypothetical protein
MRIRSLLYCLFALPAVAFADANDGQFMGYELGKAYPETSQAGERTATANLLIVAESPIKPADVKQVSLVATSVTRTVAYISAASWFASEGEARASARRYVELLRAKYPDWSFGGELMDASLRIVEVNLDKAPYNLKLRLDPEDRDGHAMWRFSMGLGWQPNSKEWLAWQELSNREQSTEKSTERRQILEDSDARGL